MLDFENLQLKFNQLIQSSEWKKVQELYNNSQHVFFFGNGGNLAVADHAAIDASRLTDKNIHAPGSGILATSIISDTSFLEWFKTWLEIRTRGLTPPDVLIIGLSCSTTGQSSDATVLALDWAIENKFNCVLVSAQPKKDLNPNVISLPQNVKHYHTSEIISMMLTYELIHGSGFKCPTIKGKARQREFDQLGIESEVDTKAVETYNKDVPPGFESELNNIAVDFDGVIHNFDKGWHDGTCYGELIEGSKEALKYLSSRYNVIIFSGKARSDRPLVEGKTGIELIWDFLVKHGLRQYVTDVVSEKPRAKFYIDDKAIEFKSWDQTLFDLQEREIE